MIRLRDKSWRRVGASLAGLALYLQLAFASLGMLAATAPAGPADALAEHALCLAAQDGAAQPSAPADPAPAAPTHDHGAFCCLWHSLPGVQSVAAAVPLPVAYARLARLDAGETAFIPRPRRGPANARAPPTIA